MSSAILKEPSSYRDPSGFIFKMDNVIYRQVNLSFKDDFDFFINSGCYKNLTDKGLLIHHKTINENLTSDTNWYRTLQPEKIPIISYPYEWSFDMLKDAALLTLMLAKESIESGLILKDASPFNIQWHNGKFVFIDTLSFERYDETMPWIGYRQFCECFLSPLLLMHYTKTSLHQLLLAYPEGIPVQITKSLLPWNARFSFHTYLHIHLQASYTNKRNNKLSEKTSFSKQKMLNLLSSLEILIRKLKSPSLPTTWSAYYEEASQRNEYLTQKKDLVKSWIENLSTIKEAIDIGANDGEFSKILADKNIFTLAVDSDPSCINNLYKNIISSNLKLIQPLIADLSNPSPSIGVNNMERNAFLSRINADLVIALAVVHHLSIGKNIPLEIISTMLSKMTKKFLIMEFVPKSDEKVQLMLKNKKDIYNNYTIEQFEKIFASNFNLSQKKEIGSSGRILYLFTKQHS